MRYFILSLYIMTSTKIKINIRVALVVVFTTITSLFYSQTAISPDVLKPDPEKEKAFFPYLAVRHGGPEATLSWKKSNTLQYYKELWYYCESFSVKRNHLASGDLLNVSIIDISRFESSRKQNEEAIVILPGFKDVLVLKSLNQLIYKPDYVK